MSNKKPIRARLNADDGTTIEVYDDTECVCGIHGIHAKWGDLDGIQQLCVLENLCSTEDLHCLLLPYSSTCKNDVVSDLTG